MLLGIGALEQVRTQLVRRLATVQGAIDGHVEASEVDGASEPEAAKRAGAVTRASREKQDTPKTTKRSTRPRSAARPAPAGT
jgi:hypothetical protein